DFDEPTAYRPPGYPFFLAILMALGCNVWLLRLANLILHCLALLFLSRLVEQAEGVVAGSLSIILGSSYCLLVYTASTIYPQSMGGFLFVLALWLVVGRGSALWRVCC